jgi:serine protease Do
MHPNRYLAGAMIGLIAPVALVQPLAIAQTPSEIAERAQQFVVQINNNSNGEYPVGSGFIIGRSGNTYQVLTNKHVLTPLGITHIAQTHDGQTYQLTNVEYLQGADLAVATFTSSRSYTVASLGQSSQLAIAQEIHIAGYPAPLSLNQPREYRFLPNSNINGFVNHQNIEDGYSIYFTADAFPGMSGSPLLNEKGKVVGIYGRAVGPNSLGIPIDLAKELAQRQNIALLTSPTPTPSPTPQENPIPKPTPTPAQTLVSRTTGVDYTPLRRLLQAGEWKQADQKTLDLMLVAANRVDAGWLNDDSLKQFSCEDLRIIDREWADASNGKFGFAAQKRVWEKVGSPGEWDDSTARQWRRMYIRLGWKTGSEKDSGGYVYSYDDLQFSGTAVVGHLPKAARRVAYRVGEVSYDWLDAPGTDFSFALRTVTCSL